MIFIFIVGNVIEYKYEVKLFNNGTCRKCNSKWMKRGTGYECECGHKHFTFM